MNAADQSSLTGSRQSCVPNLRQRPEFCGLGRCSCGQLLIAPGFPQGRLAVWNLEQLVTCRFCRGFVEQVGGVEECASRAATRQVSASSRGLVAFAENGAGVSPIW